MTDLSSPSASPVSVAAPITGRGVSMSFIGGGVGRLGVVGHHANLHCFGQTFNFELHSLSNLKSPAESFFNCERGRSFPAPGPYGVHFYGGFDSGEDFGKDGTVSDPTNKAKSLSPPRP